MRNGKASLIFIFITILVDVIGLGIIIPVVPGLLDNMLGTGLSDASKWGGWLVFTFAFMQFLCAPVLGTLSDKYGRRPVLLVSVAGLGVDYLVHGFAPNIAWLFAGRVLAGIGGASFTVAMAYIADISTREKKAQNFGIVGAAFGLGFIIGPLLGGVFAKWGVRVPFFIAAGISFLNFLYGYLILPESLDKDKRRDVQWRKANPVASLLNLRKHGRFMLLILAFFLAHIAAHSLQSTWTYFTMLKFSWDEAMVGYSLAVVGILVAIVQAILIKHVVRGLGQRKTVYAGFALWTVGMFLFSIAPTSWLLMLSLVPYCLGGVAGPTIQGIVSNKVPDTEQGELQGALTSIISVASIIGPVLMTSVFYFTTREGASLYFPGSPFFVGGLCFVLAFILTFVTLRRMSDIN